MAFKGKSTQGLVNTFPPWANIRTDEQSLGYQLLNSSGAKIDDIREQLIKNTNNFYLPTSVIFDIDCYYSYKLPGNFIFTKEANDGNNFTYTPPTVSGLVDDTYYPVEIADKNNVETFWYSAVPDRLSLGDTLGGEYLVASGFAFQSPLSPLTPSGILYNPNQLTVTISGGNSYLGMYDNKLLRKTVVQVDGKTRSGIDTVEELIFVHDESVKTIHDYEYTNEFRIYGVEDPDEAFVTITAAGFNMPDKPVSFDLCVTDNKDEMPLFWNLGHGEDPSVPTLDLCKYEADELEIRLDGFINKFPYIQQELLDENGNNYVPQDIVPEPHTNNIWVTSSTKLYLYDGKLPYPDMSALDGKQYDAASIIKPSSYWVVKGDDVELNYVWVRPTTGLVRHRVWVQKPDGTKKSLEDGIEVTYHTDDDSWIFGEPVKRAIRGTEIYTLDQRGDYIYSLEVKYTDDTTSLDKRIVSVLFLQPLGEWSLTDIGITNPVRGVDIDSDGRLWVLDNTETRYSINRHYDRMLVDFAKKTLYFRENYNQVRVYE